MRNILLIAALGGPLLLATGCGSARFGPTSDKSKPVAAVHRELTPELEAKILALDPEHVTDKDVREVLSQAPAPQIINIHGGIYPVYLAMVSFSDFLIGMGYPEGCIRRPNGAYSYSCYESSEKIAGAIAWYYEHNSLRPIIVGHSQGGMQAVKVLHKLAGDLGKRISVWNPATGKYEHRYEISDPLTGRQQPIIGFQIVSYATAVGAGGLTRILPNQWDVDWMLRKIPDTVEEFTGFYKAGDILGGDYFGFSGSANKFRSPDKKVLIRNVQLPVGYGHATIPRTSHLAKSQQIRDWINNYTPSDKPEATAKFDSESTNLLWAADVWYSIKKHWVLELQRWIRAKHAQANAR